MNPEPAKHDHRRFLEVGPTLGLSVLLLLVVASCGGTPGAPIHAPPCAADEFLYDDPACSPGQLPGDCEPHGDRLCHALCDGDSGCPEGETCQEVELFNGGDFQGSAMKRFCRAAASSG